MSVLQCCHLCLIKMQSDCPLPFTSGILPTSSSTFILSLEHPLASQLSFKPQYLLHFPAPALSQHWLWEYRSTWDMGPACIAFPAIVDGHSDQAENLKFAKTVTQFEFPSSAGKISHSGQQVQAHISPRREWGTWVCVCGGGASQGSIEHGNESSWQCQPSSSS